LTLGRHAIFEAIKEFLNSSQILKYWAAAILILEYFEISKQFSNPSALVDIDFLSASKNVSFYSCAIQVSSSGFCFFKERRTPIGEKWHSKSFLKC
jgi:hypothetical protein